MKESRYRKQIRIFWILYSIPVLFVIILFSLIGMGKMGWMPDFTDLENPQKNIASEVYAEDGYLLGKFYIENRSFVDYKEISPNVINALIATEDIRFHKHSGVDARGLGRVIVKTIIMGDDAGGGSTISQQLAKNLFERDTTYFTSSLKRKWHMGIIKFKEWVTATKLEKQYTKQEIITMYLNTVAFGHQSFGLKSASKTFFNTSTDSLKIEEAALLVGLLKAPTRYSPIINPERSLNRRNTVLSQMKKYNYISQNEYDSLSQIPIELQFNIQDHNVGLAKYFREHLRVILTRPKPERDNYFSYEQYKEDSVEWYFNPLYGWCNKNKKPNGESYNLYTDGLKIYTTINSKMQKYAEEAMTEHLSENMQKQFYKEKKGSWKGPYSYKVTKQQIEGMMIQSMKNTARYRGLKKRGVSEDSIMATFKKPVRMTIFTWDGDRDTILSPWDSIWYYKYLLRSSMMSMDPHTGHVKAYVGGLDFKYFKYDGVYRQRRQAGSVIKPFMYTLAMQEGYSPCQEVPNVPISFIIKVDNRDTIWTPRNSGYESYVGKNVTLKWGLAHSANYIAAWLIKQLNPEAVVNMIHKMGVKGEVLAVPSIIYGTSDFSIYDVVGAFSTFANKGIHTEPLLVTRIEDRNGNTLQEFTPRKTEAINETTAYLMVDMMKETVNSGTGAALRSEYMFKGQMGGKTGTTQDYSDGWYLGITPNLVTGVWVGGEDPSIRFNTNLGTGGKMALPIWALYMQRIFKDETLNITEDLIFEAPEGFKMNTDCGGYLNVNSGTNLDPWELTE
ncbi:MAG: transglycosylase domain-containing protein [Bacteroidales bacterium]|nr:transglycosylase domain-containing protein [Bacteroidales bacterium]